MYYSVSARLREGTATEFHARLTDGSIFAQEPDGKEIVESMHRARTGSDGRVHWSQACYCDTPLAHERATVYDDHFDDLLTEETDAYVAFEGEPFMEHLTQLAQG